jgi:hypothetical protein
VLGRTHRGMTFPNIDASAGAKAVSLRCSNVGHELRVWPTTCLAHWVVLVAGTTL